MNHNIEFDELFALRISFQDEFENENDIMCELKYELLKRGTPIENIPNILKQFYDYLDINMSIEQIIEILYSTHEEQISNQFINILNNYIIHNTQEYNMQEPNIQESNIQESNMQEPNIQEPNIQESNIQEPNIQENYEEENYERESNTQESNTQESNTQETYEEENYEPENYEDTSNNIITFLNNPINGNIQFTFYSSNSLNSSNTIRTIQYTFNPNSIFQPNLRNIINSNPLFSTQGIFNSLLFEPIMEDVVSTLDDSEKDKLKVYKSIEKKEEKCTICMSEINVDEQVCDLPCAHTFHDECIQPWLNHYNYKCPVCRKEVGKPKHNI
jgi:hypothetical protein